MRLLCLLLLAAGLSLSAYLLQRHFELITATEPVSDSVCTTVLHADCDATLRSPMSRILGLPLAGWGIVYYGTLAVLMLLAWALGPALAVEATLFSWLISILGAVGSGILLTMMLVGLAPFCPLCTATHLINFLLVPIYKSLTGRTWRELGLLPVVASRRMADHRPLDAVAALKIVGIACGLLCGAIIFQWVSIQQLLHPPPSDDVRFAVASFAMTSRVDIPHDSEDPRSGGGEAGADVVVFSDFQCPGCKRLAGELAGLQQAFPGQVSVRFKHFPLNTACNERIKKDAHPEACEAAQMAEAARRQGKFWEFHDAIFDSKLAFEQLDLQQIACDLGLDGAQLERDLDGRDIAEKIRADIELGVRLGVDETPAVFVGGRRAPDVRSETIRFLVMSELANKSVIPVPSLDSHDTASSKDAAMSSREIPHGLQSASRQDVPAATPFSAFLIGLRSWLGFSLDSALVLLQGGPYPQMIKTLLGLIQCVAA